MAFPADNNQGSHEDALSIRGPVLFCSICIVCCLLLPAGAGAWMFHADPQHTGVYDDGGMRPQNVTRWSLFSIYTSIRASPAIADGVLYIPWNKNIYAFNASTGATIWSHDVDDYSDSTPAISGGIVAAKTHHRMYALYVVNGTEIWNYTSVAEPDVGVVTSSPAIVNGMVYVGGDKFYARNLTTGAEIWNFSDPSHRPFYSSPAVAGNLVYIVTHYTNFLYALDIVDGTPKWSVQVAPTVWTSSSPTVRDNSLYIKGGTKIFQLNALTGTEISNYTLNDGGGNALVSISTPAVTNDCVFVGSGPNSGAGNYLITALSSSGLALIWNRTVPGSVLSSPAVANGIVYFGCNDGTLYACDSATGTILWIHPTISEGAGTSYRTIYSSPAVAGGNVFIGNDDGTLIAVGSYLPPPDVTGISPNSARAASIVNTTISGSNFTAGLATVTSLSRGGAVITGTTTSATTNSLNVTFTLPYSSPQGKWNLTVTSSPGKADTLTDAFTVTAPLAPTITSFSPAVAYRNATLNFTIKGTNFNEWATVTFSNSLFPNYTVAASLISVIPTQITGTIFLPLETIEEGTNSVTVTNPMSPPVTKNGVFTVKSWPPPTVSSVSPASGSRNATVTFSLSGTNFRDGVLVNFTNSAYTAADGNRNLTASLTSVASTKILGIVSFPFGAPTGKWDIVVTNIDAAPVRKNGSFTVNEPSKASISSVAPTSGSRNSTVQFSLSGSKFAAGAIVNFTNSTYTAPDGTRNLTAVVLSTTASKITGTVYFPLNASNGKWDISVTNPDTTPSWKNGAFTINDPVKAAVSSITPTSGTRNSTVQFSLSGSKFATGAIVNFTNSTYTAPDGTRNLTAVVLSTTASKIIGTISFPLNASNGKWDISVTNPDTSPAWKNGAFTINDPVKATVSSIAPTSGTRNSTIQFSLSGSKFATGAIVNFTNSTYTAPDGTRNLTAVVLSTTASKLTGTISFPLNASNGKWDISVTNPDTSPAWKNGAFTLSDPTQPTISSVNPTSGTRSTMVNFTLSGSRFRSGIVVNFTNSTYIAPGGYSNLTTVITLQTATQVKGSLAIPAGVPTGKWDVVAINPDAPESRKNGAFTVK